MTMNDIFEFLEQLAANNDRVWFAENKARYDELRAYWLGQLQRLIDALAAEEPRLRHIEARDCAYRIYRDTRFSLDKTPYKTYFSALISPTGRHFDGACYYIHIGLEESGLYGGIWMPESKLLKKLRKAIVDNIEEFREIIKEPALLAAYPDWEGPMLKTAPQGYDRNDPNIDLLRLQQFGRAHLVGRRFFSDPDWPEKAAKILLLLKPMNDFINYSLYEE